MSATSAANHKRREQGDATRKIILDAASGLIAKYGYDATSLSMIASASGFPSSSIYWHFGSKEGVLAAVMKQGADHFFTFFQKAPWFSGTPSERLRQALVHTGHSLLTDPEHRQFLNIQLRFRLNRRQRPDDREFVATADSVRAGGIEFMRRWISDSYAEYGREFSDAAAAEFAEFGVLLVDGVFIALQEAEEDEDAQAVKRDLLLNWAATALVSLVEARRTERPLEEQERR